MQGVLVSKVILIGLLAVASSQAADLKGRVSDVTGGALSGAVLTLTEQGSGQRRTSLAGADGRYGFDTLQEGAYLLEAELGGFQSFGVTVVVSGPTQYDVVLEVADLVEQVVVTGTRIPTPVDQEGRSVSVITAREMEVRQQRFVYEALQSVPGIQVTRS